MKSLVKFFPIYLLCILFVWSCSKDKMSTDANAIASISFSVDTVKFDTVFTSQGSITQIVKIFNLNNQKVQFSSIELSGGDQSSFDLNINGRAVNTLSNITLEQGDSLYLFVKANINPNNENAAFVVSDSVQFHLNGNSEKLYLQAYGQNARYINSASATKDTNWNATLPIVLMNDFSIPTNTKLSVAKGTKVYFHGNSHLLVDGSLQLLGDSTARISLTTDRLDYGYNTLAGSWGGITFGANSKENVLKYTTIKNAQIAIADTNNISNLPNYKLTLNSCEIWNNSIAGIQISNSSMYIYNSLIYNNYSSVIIAGSGTYDMIYNTIAGYSNSLMGHNGPCVSIKSGSGSMQLSLKNSIIYGENISITNELDLDNALNSNNATISVANSLIKRSAFPSFVTSSANIFNENPNFILVNNNQAIYNFHISENSPAYHKAAYINTIPVDYQGNIRNVTTPSIGCFE